MKQLLLYTKPKMDQNEEQQKNFFHKFQEYAQIHFLAIPSSALHMLPMGFHHAHWRNLLKICTNISKLKYDNHGDIEKLQRTTTNNSGNAARKT